MRILLKPAAGETTARRSSQPSIHHPPPTDICSPIMSFARVLLPSPASCSRSVSLRLAPRSRFYSTASAARRPFSLESVSTTTQPPLLSSSALKQSTAAPRSRANARPKKAALTLVRSFVLLGGNLSEASCADWPPFPPCHPSTPLPAPDALGRRTAHLPLSVIRHAPQDRSPHERLRRDGLPPRVRRQARAV